MKRILLCMLCCLLLAGCGGQKAEADYSHLNFVGVTWLRDTVCDETLRFLPDGGFRYSCACGSPVDDADVVERYSFEEDSATIKLHYLEDMNGGITTIDVISCDGDKLELDFGGEIRVFYREGVSIPFSVDFTKVSPMIESIADAQVVTAAKTVIEAFLRYETQAPIEISGNSQRFMNDMAYVIHCTCPVFGAFADFNEITAYDETTGMVSWQFTLSQEEFTAKLQEFYGIAEGYLSQLVPADSEALRAMVLYYNLIDDLGYDYGLVGENYEKLSPREAALRSSSYYTLVEKSGICTNIAQAYVFLCTQADITCGTVLHSGGSGMHMWNIVQIDGHYYYCDPTWDAGTSMKYFGLTAADRAEWAGGYSDEEGSMLSLIVPNNFAVTDERFADLRGKLPVEMTGLHADKSAQSLTFLGYEYEFTFACQAP